MNAISETRGHGSALLDRPAPGSALKSATEDCFCSRLQEVSEMLKRISEGNLDWTELDHPVAPPKASGDYCAREARNIAKVLSFRETQIGAEMIPSPIFCPDVEDGEMVLEWNKMPDSVSFYLEWEKEPRWAWFHFDTAKKTHETGYFSIHEEKLWEKMQEKVCSVFLG